jgi:hypothetical protein
MKIVPLPSPRGTNFEGLYQTPRGGSAFDAAPRRRARDADPDAVQGALGALQTHMKARMNGDDFAAGSELLGKLLEVLVPQDDDTADPDDQAAEDRRKRMTGDGRPAFRRDPRSAAERFGDIAMPTQLGPRPRW